MVITEQHNQKQLIDGALQPHISVLKQQVIDAIPLQEGAVYVDATFGAGGHSRCLLQKAERQGLTIGVIGIDRDASVLPYAQDLAEEFLGKFYFVVSKFGDIAQAVTNIMGADACVSGIIMDLGVSSMQLDQAHRGFSFNHDAPLNMQMDEGGSQPASQFINKATESEIADVLFHLGGERFSRRIASSIVKKRQEAEITSTLELAGIISQIYGKKIFKEKIHPATRSFQAIRMHVNNELGELKQGLSDSCNLLTSGGRLAVISFHSGEDSIVKKFFKEKSEQEKQSHPSRYDITQQQLEEQLKQYQEQQLKQEMQQQEGGNITKHKPYFEVVNKKPITPSEKEISANPRSRSAKLRILQKLAREGNLDNDDNNNDDNKKHDTENND